MIQRGRRGLQIAAACALLAAYSGLSHYCNTHSVPGVGIVLALAPPLALGLSLLWRSTPPWIAGPLTVVMALLLYDGWTQLEKKFSMVYLIQECGMYSLLAFGFGRSLGRGDIALCTRLADRLHGPLTPHEVRYTRQVTAAWAIFFGALTLTILGLYSSGLGEGLVAVRQFHRLTLDRADVRGRVCREAPCTPGDRAAGNPRFSTGVSVEPMIGWT